MAFTVCYTGTLQWVWTNTCSHGYLVCILQILKMICNLLWNFFVCKTEIMIRAQWNHFKDNTNLYLSGYINNSKEQYQTKNMKSHHWYNINRNFFSWWVLQFVYWRYSLLSERLHSSIISCQGWDMNDKLLTARLVQLALITFFQAKGIVNMNHNYRLQPLDQKTVMCLMESVGTTAHWRHRRPDDHEGTFW